MRALLDYAHDVALELYRDGVELPDEPGYFKQFLYILLYTPMTWSSDMNGYVYQFVAFVLQASQVRGITIEGGAKYNVPSANITLIETGNPPPPDLTSYTGDATIGADDFNDDNVTITDLFDIVVDFTRRVTPTCAFLDNNPTPFLTDSLPIESGPSGISVLLDGPSVPLNGFPRLPLSRSKTQFWLSGIWLTRSRRSRMRKRLPTCSATTHFCLNISALDTQPLLSIRLALWP